MRWIAGFMPGLAGRTALLSVMVGQRTGQGEYSNKVMMMAAGQKILTNKLDFRERQDDSGTECDVELFEEDACNTSPCPQGFTKSDTS